MAMWVKKKYVPLFEPAIPSVTAPLNDSNSLFGLSKQGYYLYQGPIVSCSLCVSVCVCARACVCNSCTEGHRSFTCRCTYDTLGGRGGVEE